MFQNYATGTTTYSAQGGSIEAYQTLEVHTELSFASEEENTSEANTAVNEYPRFSAITATQDSGADILSDTKPNSSTRQERTNFVESLATRVQVKLNQPFGKKISPSVLKRKRVFVMCCCLCISWRSWK